MTQLAKLKEYQYESAQFRKIWQSRTPQDKNLRTVIRNYLKYFRNFKKRIKEEENKKQPNDLVAQILSVLISAQEELRLIRSKDCNVVYDPTLKSRLEVLIDRLKNEKNTM